MGNGFPKRNKLCGKKQIELLYKTGRHFVVWPLRVTCLPAEDETQVLVWAPKSLFKRAVHRNHLRRLMREAYRLNQAILGEERYLLAFNYMDKEAQDYGHIRKAMCKALKKVREGNEKMKNEK